MSLGETQIDEVENAWFLTAKQLAALMQVSLRTLWRMRSAEQLPSPVRIGGTIRWRRDEIEKWIRDGCPPPARGKPR